MNRVKDLLKRKLGSALAQRLVPWPVGNVVAALPERTQLPFVGVFYCTLLGAGVAFRFSNGQPLLGAGGTRKDDGA